MPTIGSERIRMWSSKDKSYCMIGEHRAAHTPSGTESGFTRQQFQGESRASYTDHGKDRLKLSKPVFSPGILRRIGPIRLTNGRRIGRYAYIERRVAHAHARKGVAMTAPTRTYRACAKRA
jgi:hypothetical protein